MELFNQLRALRREKAQERRVPAYIIFNDAALRDMARLRPSTLDGFLSVKGVGQKKCDDYGQEFLRAIAEYCGANSAEMDSVSMTLYR